jgi:hypothetical protein
MGRLFGERPQAGTENFDVDLSARGGGSGFGESNLGLKQVAFEAIEIIEVRSGACAPRKAGGLVGRR